MLGKISPSCWENNLFSIPLVNISDSMDEFRQLSIKNVVIFTLLYFLLKGTSICYQLDPSLLNRTMGPFMSLWSERCFMLPLGRVNISHVKKYKNIMRSKWPLIRPTCVRICFWLDPVAFEPFIRHTCAWSRLWTDSSALKVACDPHQVRPCAQNFTVISSAKRSGMCWKWSDRDNYERKPQPGTANTFSDQWCQIFYIKIFQKIYIRKACL